MKKVDLKEPINRGMLDEAIDAILKGVEVMFSKQGKRFDKLEAGQRDLQRQINDLKYDTPTQKEFEDLKTRVDKYHPFAKAKTLCLAKEKENFCGGSRPPPIAR